MKKTGIALAILLAAGVAVTGGAWFTGKQLQAVIDDKIAEANEELARQLPGSEVRLTLASLERGVFSSQARYQIALGELAADLPASELVLIEHIEHGPLPLSRLSSLQLLPVMAYSQARLEENPLTASLFEMSQGAEPLTLNTTLGYDQSAQVAVNVAPLQFATSELTFGFSGFAGEFEGSTEIIRGNARFDRLELAAQGAQAANVSLHDFRLDMDRAKGAAGVFLGEQSARIARMEMNWPGMAPLALNDIGMRDHISQTADLLSAEFVSHVGEVTYAGNPLGSLHMDWSARDLNAAAVKELTDLAARYVDTLEMDPEQTDLSPAQEEQLMASLHALLASKPTLSLDRLSLKTANAETRLSIAAGLNQPQDDELTPQEAIRQVLSSLEVQLDLPKDTIRDLVGYKALFDPSLDPQEVTMEATMTAEMASDMAVGMQLASLDGETIKSRLSYANDEVTFNGTTQSLDEFLAGLGMLFSGVENE